MPHVTVPARRTATETSVPQGSPEQHFGSLAGTVPSMKYCSTASFTQEFDLLYAVCPSPS